jgi:hypothetical protein
MRYVIKNRKIKVMAGKLGLLIVLAVLSNIVDDMGDSGMALIARVAVYAGILGIFLNIMKGFGRDSDSKDTEEEDKK